SSTQQQIEALQKKARTETGPAKQAIQDQIQALRDQASGSEKAAKASDKQATAQAAIGLLQQKDAGQAKAFGQTQQGAFDRLGVAWENLKEKLGSDLAPTLTKAANGLANFVQEMVDGTGKGGKFVDFLKQLGPILVDLGAFLVKVTDKTI